MWWTVMASMVTGFQGALDDFQETLERLGGLFTCEPDGLGDSIDDVSL
jgi:hypothetical protein